MWNKLLISFVTLMLKVEQVIEVLLKRCLRLHLGQSLGCRMLILRWLRLMSRDREEMLLHLRAYAVTLFMER
jgi:hypothetical protein